jgi:hypothetical protein
MPKRRDGVECNTTCQICARPILAKTGLIAHHGYERPSWNSGYQSPSCYGARKLPYEQDRTAIAEYVTRYTGPTLGRLQKLQARIAAGGPDLEVPNPAYIRWMQRKLNAQNGWAGQNFSKDPPPATLAFVERPEYPDGVSWQDLPSSFHDQQQKSSEYNDALRSWTYEVDRQVRWTQDELDRLTARYEAWVAPQVAPV